MHNFKGKRYQCANCTFPQPPCSHAVAESPTKALYVSISCVLDMNMLHAFNGGNIQKANKYLALLNVIAGSISPSYVFKL